MSDRNQTNELARKHLDKRLNALRSSPVFTRPPKGWLRAIRDALGMTTRQVAAKCGVSQPTVTAWEKGEVQNSITFGKLREAAEALDCELVYALVPRKSLNQMVEERAVQVVDAQLSNIDHSMRLEGQGLKREGLEAERKRMIDELLRSNPGDLWKEP